MLGGDPVAMRRLAAAMEQEATDLRGRLRAVQQDVDTVWWSGPDADRFRSAWSSEHVRHLGSTIDRLLDTARLLRREAAMQERASDA